MTIGNRSGNLNQVPKPRESDGAIARSDVLMGHNILVAGPRQQVEVVLRQPARLLSCRRPYSHPGKRAAMGMSL